MRALLLSVTVLISAAIGGTLYLRTSVGASEATTAASSPHSIPESGGPDTQAARDGNSVVSAVQATATVETGTGAETADTAEAAATEAAVAAVRSTANMVTDGYFTRRDLISNITTQQYGPELIELTSLSLSNFSFEVDTSEQFWLIVEPLRSKAHTTEPGRVRVEIWALAIVASTESGVARESWQTLTLDMQLVEDRWLVDAWATDNGPTPAPSTDLVFSSPSELGEVMLWPVAPATVSTSGSGS